MTVTERIRAVTSGKKAGDLRSQLRSLRENKLQATKTLSRG